VTLPTLRSQVYARLYQRINNVWQSADTTYTEGGTITPATLSPTAGTVLTREQTFSWGQWSRPFSIRALPGHHRGRIVTTCIVPAKPLQLLKTVTLPINE